MINVDKYFCLAVAGALAAQQLGSLPLSSWSFICHGSLKFGPACYLFMGLRWFAVRLRIDHHKPFRIPLGEFINILTEFYIPSGVDQLSPRFDLSFLGDEILLFHLDPFNDPLGERRKQEVRFLSAPSYQGAALSFLFSPVLMKKVIVIYHLSYRPTLMS